MSVRLSGRLKLFSMAASCECHTPLAAGCKGLKPSETEGILKCCKQVQQTRDLDLSVRKPMTQSEWRSLSAARGYLLREGDGADEGRDARAGELPREDVLDGLWLCRTKRQVQGLRAGQCSAGGFVSWQLRTVQIDICIRPTPPKRSKDHRTLQQTEIYCIMSPAVVCIRMPRQSRLRAHQGQCRSVLQICSANWIMLHSMTSAET